jgi:uncharacterized membrane protein YhhN
MLALWGEVSTEHQQSTVFIGFCCFVVAQLCYFFLMMDDDDYSFVAMALHVE